MKLSPIVLFVYNRPWHTKKTLDALRKNNLAKKSKLFIFSDGYKGIEDKESVQKVRKVIKEIKGFGSVEIVERDENNGLANSIIAGVTEVVEKYGKVIVLEDDLVTSSTFLNYMNSMLNTYENEKKVFSISGYNHPLSLMKIPESYPYDIYFNLRCSSWSWATWRDRWEKADWEVEDFNEFLKNKNLQKKFNRGGEDMSQMLTKQMDGEIDSWAIRWCYAHFRNEAYCGYPVKSYTDNIGHDGSGVHCGKSNSKYKNTKLNGSMQICFPNKVKIDNKIMDNFRRIYKGNSIKKFAGKALERLDVYEFVKYFIKK